MKPDENQLRAVLDDVVPASAEKCGPGCGSVLEMVRNERARRKRASAIFTVASTVLALTAALSIWPRAVPEPDSIAAAPESPRVVINPVNDEELFALLEETPAALMEWPNGDRTLLVVVGRQ